VAINVRHAHKPDEPAHVYEPLADEAQAPPLNEPSGERVLRNYHLLDIGIRRRVQSLPSQTMKGTSDFFCHGLARRGFPLEPSFAALAGSRPARWVSDTLVVCV